MKIVAPPRETVCERHSEAHLKESAFSYKQMLRFTQHDTMLLSLW